MRNRTIRLVLAALVWSFTLSMAYAQRGMGDSTGLARQAVKPELVSLAGKLLAVETQPCDKTTGGGRVGTHIVLETKQGEKLNIHLGWARAVEDIARRLTLGKKIEVMAFRTDKMPAGHFVAQSLRFEKRTVQLREQNLRPLWAGGGRGWRVGGGRGWRGGSGLNQ
jgi:hypothetical protein